MDARDDVSMLGGNATVSAEAAELGHGIHPNAAVRFEGYESYVDAAVASLRASFLAEAEAFKAREATMDEELLRHVTARLGDLVETVDHFLMTTVTITEAGAADLRKACAGAQEHTLKALADVREAQRADAHRSHETMLDNVVTR